MGVGGIECDETLFDRLRRLRKKIADERGLPAYIIFSDVSLRQMARYYPTTAAEFARINGVGERKLADFGEVFMDSIAGYLNKESAQEFLVIDTSGDLIQRSVFKLPGES
jgi:ATP-dependent DNA helicase RecQ